MKRIASLLIALFLFCGAVATAEETVETRSDSTGTYEYVLLEDGSAEITGYSGDAEVLEIPQSWMDIPSPPSAKTHLVTAKI